MVVVNMTISNSSLRFRENSNIFQVDDNPDNSDFEYDEESDEFEEFDGPPADQPSTSAQASDVEDDFGKGDHLTKEIHSGAK
ncbi:hypothetical protein L5515_009441 [Caenorhabditis briggsae]|uniref:Uncharacterized protein n=1 Tax=Caenorhabditis briggsae TaxID=6238 RepID=A0AAE9F818_CAEBR|nr:hypothetical protein L5515_009441 [Caenorhabditis briggsae]